METQTLKYLITFEAQDAAKVISAIKQVKANTDDLDVTLRKMGNGASSAGINLGGLVSRAVVTIPVWLALRSAFMGTLGYINDSAESIIKLDKALKEAQNEIQGVTNLVNVMKNLRDAAVDLSKESGTAPEKIVDAFKKFSSSGLDTQAALAGMRTATRGAIANNDDLTETTQFLTDAYKIYGDRITQVTGAQEKFNYIMGTVASLMPANTFTLKEFIGAATNFLPVAKNLNLTLDETFTLIATAATGGQRGPKAGTQIASALQKMQESGSRQKIADFLRGPDGGDPLKGLTQFQILVEVLKKISVEGDKAAATVDKIFGLKGTKFIFTEASDMQAFIQQFQQLQNLTPNERNEAEAKRYATAMKEIASQANRIKEALGDIGRNFLTGIFGDADQIAGSLKSIADVLVDVSHHAKDAGQAVKDLVVALGLLVAAGGAARLITAIGGGAAVARQAIGAFGVGGAMQYAALSTPVTASVGIPAAIAGGVITHYGDQARNAWNDADKGDEEAQRQFLIKNDLEREKKGLKRIRPDLSANFTLKPIVVGGKEEPKTADQKSAFDEELKKADQILLTEIKMQSLGFNNIEIQKQKIVMLEDEAERYKALVDLAKMENEEIAKMSQQLQSTFSGGLTDLLMGRTNFADFGKKIGDTIREGITGAVADNFTEQIFKSTGIGDMFGGIVSNLRHANDGIAGPIKTGFDYGAKASYNAIVKGFSDGMSGKSGGGVTAASFAGGNLGGMNLGGIGGFQAPTLTLPGFGPGGVMSRQLYGGQAGMTGANGQLLTAGGKALTGPTIGAAAGAVGFAATTGFSAYQAAGGSQGSLSVPAGIAGTLGGAALGLSALGFAGAGTAAATAVGAALGPVGWALLAGAALFSMFSKTKNKTESTQVSEQQIGPKIDQSNTKLDIVNRNLTAIKSSLTTFVMPDSAYFSEARNLSDEFSISARR